GEFRADRWGSRRRRTPEPSRKKECARISSWLILGKPRSLNPANKRDLPQSTPRTRRKIFTTGGTEEHRGNPEGNPIYKTLCVLCGLAVWSAPATAAW